ncbi:glutamate ABC transporter substrate-binding protein [soil metagenome]
MKFRTLRRSPVLALLLVFALFAAVACGDDDDETETETGGDDTTEETTDGSGEDEAEVPEFDPGTTMAELQEAGSMTVGTKFDQPLFGLRSATSGDLEGFDVEIAKLIAEGIFGEGGGDNVEFVETPSRIREEAIEQGDVDIVVATYTINDERKERIDFAGPYYIAGQDIMVAADDDSISGVEDLNGKKVCSVQGSTSLDNLIAMAPEADASLTFDTYSLCAEALGDGRVDAVTTDNIILLGLVDDSDGEFKLVGNTFTEEPYGIGLPKDDQEFRDFINDRLEEIYESGEWADAYESTAGQVDDSDPEPPPVDRYESTP